MRKRVTYICLIVTLLSCPRAEAAPVVEFVPPRGFLLLGDIRQWASLVYDYRGHEFSNAHSSGSSTHQFRETYHFGDDFSIIDPDLLSIKFDGELSADQNRSNGAASASRSNDVQFGYSLFAAAFAKEPYPVAVNSSRDQHTVTGTFTPSYTSTVTSNGVMANYLHRVLPIRIRYQRTTLDTSGLSQDSSTASDILSLGASSHFRDTSFTELNLDLSKQQVTSGLLKNNSRAYSLNLSNNLNFDSEKRYTLGTGLQVQDSLLLQNAVAIPQRNAALTEALACRFGSALQGGLSYRYSYNKTVGFDNSEQLLQSNQFGAFLSHRLYRNLETSISGEFTKSSPLGGEEITYGGTAAVNYRRNLPAESLLTLGATGSHQVTDRNLPVSTLTLRDEEHRVIQQGEGFPLKNIGQHISVISVISHNPEITYLAGRDYTLDFPAIGNIFIFTGGTIAPGTDLFITYNVKLNPLVKYATDSVSLSNALSLFRDRYRISGNLSVQSQTLISGQATDSSLADTRTAQIRAEANYPDNTLSLEYGAYSSGSANYDYFEWGWRYYCKFPQSAFTLRIRDRYTIYGRAGGGSRSYSENSADLGGSYTRYLFSWVNLLLDLNFHDTRGGALSSDYLYFRTQLQGRINSTLLNLAGQTIWRLNGSQTTRDDSARIEATRYF